MAIIIKKRKVADLEEAAPLVEGGLTAEKVRVEAPLAPAPKAEAPQMAPAEPPAGEVLHLNGESIRVSGSAHFIKMLKDRPEKLAQYIAAHKRPMGARTTACGFCGHHYILPCIGDADTSTCMNHAFLKAQGKL